MRLLRTAFWLGITIYCLPSTKHPTAPQSSLNNSQCRLDNAANISRLCAWESESDTHRPRVVIKGREQREHGSPRETVMPSQDTLTPSDLAPRWRGSAVGKEREARLP
jgi:hypothetical protein